MKFFYGTKKFYIATLPLNFSFINDSNQNWYSTPFIPFYLFHVQCSKFEKFLSTYTKREDTQIFIKDIIYQLANHVIYNSSIYIYIKIIKREIIQEKTLWHIYFPKNHSEISFSIN